MKKNVYAAIKEFCKDGDHLATLKKIEEAISFYNKAYELIPESKNDFEATTRVLAAIGDSYFLGEYYTSGKETFSYAVTCPSGLGNSFIQWQKNLTIRISARTACAGQFLSCEFFANRFAKSIENTQLKNCLCASR